MESNAEHLATLPSNSILLANIRHLGEKNENGFPVVESRYTVKT